MSFVIGEPNTNCERAPRNENQDLYGYEYNAFTSFVYTLKSKFTTWRDLVLYTKLDNNNSYLENVKI